MSMAAEPFSISREFKAPKTLLYQVFTDPKHLEKWMSPEGFQTIHAAMDFQVGGTYHYGLEGPNGMKMWGKQVFREITHDERIEHIQSFSNDKAEITQHPMSPTWPLEMRVTTRFDETSATTTQVTIMWQPWNSNEIGNACFDGARAGMEQGFNGTFSKLESYLTEIFH